MHVSHAFTVFNAHNVETKISRKFTGNIFGHYTLLFPGYYFRVLTKKIYGNLDRPVNQNGYHFVCTAIASKYSLGRAPSKKLCSQGSAGRCNALYVGSRTIETSLHLHFSLLRTLTRDCDDGCVAETRVSVIFDEIFQRHLIVKVIFYVICRDGISIYEIGNCVLRSQKSHE